MKTQKARDVKPTSPSGRPKYRFTLRGRKKKARAIRGKLRIRSMPGAFLVLGVVVVVVGTALAVAGYWPYRMSRSPILGPAEGESISESHASAWSLGAKGLLSSGSLMHSERMKLLGPVIMGVGLFILICANTVLYENRDRETQMLLAQMRSVICSVSAVVPSADLSEIAAANSMAKHYQWVSSLPAAHLNILCVQQLASSEPLLRTRGSPERGGGGAEGVCQRSVLRTEALHHQESESPPSLRSPGSDSCNSTQTDLNTMSEHGGDAGLHQRGASPVKVNNCLVSASSLSTLGGDEGDVPPGRPRRCHSMSYRTKPHAARTGARPQEGLHAPPREEGRANQAEDTTTTATTRGGGSQVCVNMPGGEEQTRQSWPRLDLGGGGRRYLKLENKEDSVDKLLDQLEQQCSQWDRSFGSGPFQ